MCSGRLIGATLGGAARRRSSRALLYIAGMRSRRRLVPLLAMVALTVPAAPARAQGAGDDQYQDPFGAKSGSSGSSSRKSSPAPRRQVAQAQTQPGLSQAPPGSAPSASPPAATQTPAPAGAAPAAAALPRTGMEIPGMALLGVGLLVSGVGLRLRTLDDTLY